MSLAWDWGGAGHRAAEHAGRSCVRLDTSLEVAPVATVAGCELEDGTIEAELCVGAQRSFHGVVWRVQDARNYESFFVRPHQSGNPDAIQYTPVSNGLSSWQLYHGDGFWNAIELPIGEWFTVRVAFAGDRAEVSLDGERVLLTRLRRPRAPGGVGVLVGGDGLLLGGFSHDAATPSLDEPPALEPVDGIVPAWLVSDPFAEDELPQPELGDALAGRTWTRLETEPTGLADLSRVHGLERGNTVFARATIEAARSGVHRLELGFSDRAVVYLGGRALFAGSDAYRSRDYRFLGSIGWHDALYLPLDAGANELVVAVSEDFGGWGIQARLLRV